MFKSAGLAKMFAGRRKFFRGPRVRHLWFSSTSAAHLPKLGEVQPLTAKPIEQGCATHGPFFLNRFI